MGHLDPIAYTFEADYHCPGCTLKRFPESREWPGTDVNGDQLEDSEGNEVGAVFPWDEWWNLEEGCETLNCSDCFGEIDTCHAEDCTENFGETPCTLIRTEA